MRVNAEAAGAGGVDGDVGLGGGEVELLADDPGLLGLAEPRYRHHRLVLDPSGAKLSKSRQSWSLAELRATGLNPGAVRAALGFGVGAVGGLVVEFG